jgi:L-asparagine transporter-like permease
MTVALLFSVYLNYIMPENVFLVIASLATFATVWVWIMILLSQIAFRRRLSPEEAKALKFKVPGGVATTVVGLIFLVFIIGLIGYHPDTRISYVGCAWIVLLLVGWVLNAAATVSWRKRSNKNAGGAALTRPTLLLPRKSSPSSSPNKSHHDELSLTTLWQGDVNFIRGDS